MEILTRNKPKALVPVNNLPMILHLFRKYPDKKFIIIGNINAITYKEFFPLLRDNQVWVGATNFNRGMYFNVPADFKYRDSYKFLREIDGKPVSRVAGCCWYTNMDFAKRHEKMILWQTYTPDTFPHYDEFDAINVDKITNIPADYDGVMGVPITFLGTYNPDQFDILNCSAYSDADKFGCQPLYINGKKVYARILIRKKAGA